LSNVVPDPTKVNLFVTSRDVHWRGCRDDKALVRHKTMAKRGQALRKAGARRRPPKPGVALKQEIAALRRELAQSLERQTATSDVLKIISRSPVDLGAVLDMVVETVAHLCRADQAYLFRSRDDKHHLVASHGLSSEAREFVLSHPLAPIAAP
jgi:hypothetical protein